MKILMLVTNNYEDLESIGTLDVLRRGNIDVDVVSLAQETVHGKYNSSFNNLKLIKDINLSDYDGLFIPGGPQFKEMSNDKRVDETIMYFYNKSLPMAAICAAPVLFGKLGILKNRTYTCFYSMNDNFGGYFKETHAVKDNFIITGCGAGGTLDFAYLFLELLTSKENAEKVKNTMLY